MILSDSKTEKMLKAAKPLIKWMNENCHPHTKIIVTHNGVELLESISVAGTNEFLED